MGASLVGHREQVEAEAGEGDHHCQHPVLGDRRLLVVGPVDEGAVVGQHQAADVADHERGDLDVPDRVGAQDVVVDAGTGDAEEVGVGRPEWVGEQVSELRSSRGSLVALGATKEPRDCLLRQAAGAGRGRGR